MFNSLKVVRDGLKEVEHHIAPPMAMAITLPVHVEELGTEVIVYICVGAFSPQPIKNVTNLVNLAQVIADRIERE